jgi:TRAF3-interacting protein 1
MHAKGGSDDHKSFSTMDAPKESESKMVLEMDQPVIPERGKSRGGTRGGKPQQATADTGLSGIGNSMAPRLDAEIERCDGSEATTQLLLGELISRPKLTEKLLSKPPFRFLHDIVMEVIRATGFANGLYNEMESDSANVTSREQKIEFLEKITKLVGTQLNTLVEAKPTKIVAGMEPQATNAFLQLLAVAAKHMPDSTAALKTVLEQGDGARPIAASVPAASSTRAVAESPPRDVAPSRSDAEAMPAKRPQPSSAVSEAKESAASQNREFIQDDKQSGQENTVDFGGDGGDEKRSTRPSTAARRRPPKVKEGATELQAKDTVVPTAKKAAGIIVDGADDDEIDEVIGGEEAGSRLVDELRADSKNDDTNANNPQSKLVQNIISRQVEQEAAAGGKNKDSKAAASPIETEDSKQSDAGGGIRLSRLRKPGTDKKGKDGATPVPTSIGEGDLEKMRQAIQSLVQQTGPLGTCLDFIQEDISLMSGELHKWEEECRRYEVEYDEARKKTKEKLIPLRNELDEINDQIAEQISLISATKNSNLKMEEKIQATLKMIATS